MTSTQSDSKTSAPPRRPADHVADLKQLVTTYAKQEIVTPLSSLGKYLQWAITAAVLMGVGSFFLLLALLRGMQSIDAFNPAFYGEDSYRTLVPYAITLVGAILLGVFGYVRIVRDKQLRRKG